MPQPIKNSFKDNYRIHISTFFTFVIMYYSSMDKSLELKRIGSKIRFFRNHSKLTLEQLSEKCGVSANYLSRIERGEENVTYMKILAIAEGLTVPLSVIVQKENVRENEAQDAMISELIFAVKKLDPEELQKFERILRLLFDIAHTSE